MHNFKTKRGNIPNRIVALTMAAMMVVSNVTGVVASAATDTAIEQTIAVGAVQADVALNNNLTGSKVTFAGGNITSDGAPSVNNATFEGAYIWIGGSKSKVVPVTYLTTSDGQVYYKINDGGKNNVNSQMGVDMLYLKSANDTLVFNYKSGTTASDRYTVSYAVTKSGQSGLDAIGGNAQVVNASATIGAGESGYFQVVRAAGTSVSVSASNGSLVKVNTSSDGYVETYKLSGVTTNTKVTVTEKWNQTSYAINLTAKTASLPTNLSAYAAGRILIKTAQVKDTVFGSSSAETKGLIYSAQAYGNKTAKTLNWSTTMENSNSLSDNKIVIPYIANKISYSGSPKGHQALGSLVISSGSGASESVKLPKTKGASETTILNVGEKAGTKVTVEYWGVETAADSAKTPVYSVTIENIHTDINITLNYVDSRNKNLTSATADSGFELLKSINGGDSTTFDAGEIISTSKNNVDVLYKLKAGYYNGKLIVAKSNDSTTYSVSSLSTSSGYKQLSFNDELTIENDPVTAVSAEATAVSYSVEYNANGGAYTAGVPSYNSVYKVDRDGGSNVSSVIVVSPLAPTRDNYTFAGYKIKGNSKGTTYKPGDFIDLNSGSISLSDYAVASNGTAKIVFEAQWTGPITSNADTTTITLTEKTPDADNAGSYVETVSTFVAPVGVQYALTGYADEDNALPAIEAENVTGTVSKTASDNNITVTYGHKVSVTYEKGDGVDGNMPNNIIDTTARQVTLASDEFKLTKADELVSKNLEGAEYYSAENNARVAKYVSVFRTFQHIGWLDKNTGTAYDFGETVKLTQDGLNLVPNFKETTVEEVSYAVLAAKDFNLSIEVAKLIDSNNIDVNSELGQKLIALADAQSYIAKDAADSQDRVASDIVAISSQIQAAEGTYDLSFTSVNGLTRTVKVNVVTGKVVANDFVVSLAKAKSIMNDDDAIILLANALGYEEDKSLVPVKVKSNNIEAKAGEYTVIFEADNYSKTNAAIKVTVLGEVIVAKDFQVALSQVKDLTNEQLLALAEAKAYSGDLSGEAVALTVQESTIKDAEGVYNVTFATENGTTQTIGVTVVADAAKPDTTTPETTTPDATKPDTSVTTTPDTKKPDASTTTPSGSGAAGSTTVAEQSVLNRYAGANRAETSIKVAEAMKENADSKFNTIIVASANSFADALSGSYLSYITDAPILTVNDTFKATVASYVKKNLADGGKVFILGGTGAVSKAFETALVSGSSALGTDQVERLAGTNRYLTNIEILKKSYELAAGTDKASTTILVSSGNEYADSLSAAATKMPILLVDKVAIKGEYLKAAQTSYLDASTIKDAIIIGGTGAVLPGVVNELKAMLGQTSLERISGANRYETSVKIAERFFTASDVNSVTFAYGLDFPDGLAAGPLAIKNNSPLILIAGTATDLKNNKNFVTTDSRARYANSYLEAFADKAMKYSVVGGTGVISASLAKQLTGVAE
jgi:putative cell wall-binding protein